MLPLATVRCSNVFKPTHDGHETKDGKEKVNSSNFVEDISFVPLKLIIV